MQALLRGTAAAALAMLASADPSASVAHCAKGSGLQDGVCKELLGEQGAAVELLQKRADRSQPLNGQTAAGVSSANASSTGALAVEFAAVKATTNASAATDAAASASANRSNPFALPFDIPDVKDLVPGNVAGAATAAAVDAFVIALNATLAELDEQAKKFLAEVTKYKDGLLSKVRDSGDKAIETLEGLVSADTKNIAFKFGTIVETINTATPAITKILDTILLKDLAKHLEQNMNKLIKAAQRVMDKLNSIDSDVAALGNATEAEMDKKLAALNATAQAGLDAAKEMEEELIHALKGNLIRSVAHDLGIDIGEEVSKENAKSQKKLELLIDMAEELVKDLAEALKVFFFGTTKAAELAVEQVEQSKSQGVAKGGVEGLQLSAGVLLAVVTLGLH